MFTVVDAVYLFFKLFTHRLLKKVKGKLKDLPDSTGSRETKKRNDKHLSQHADRQTDCPPPHLLHLPKGNKVRLCLHNATEAHLDDLFIKGGGLKTKSEALALCVQQSTCGYFLRVKIVSMFH